MAEELTTGMQCGEFDALLADALDGTLSGTRQLRFDAHRTSCPACSAMFDEVSAGMNWLKDLPELEPPAGFVQRVMLATSGVASESAKAAEQKLTWQDRLRGYFNAALRPVMHPRFAMSFGMAFFSITLVLNVIGVRVTDLKHVDLRPSAIVRGYYETTGRLVKYYENIRFVYELETRVRELKRLTAPTDNNQQEQQQQQQKQNKKQNEPEQRNYQNFSRDDAHTVLASNPGHDLVEPWFPAQRRYL